MNDSLAGISRPVALVTGGSRGVGAATVLALAEAGYNVVINYRNKARRAEAVATDARRAGATSLVVQADITDPDSVIAMMSQIRAEFGQLDALILNASGGMEKDLILADPDYPMRINRDAPMALVEQALPLFAAGGVVVHVTSHLAHFYGQVEQLPAYEPVAASKHAGEVALLAAEPDLNRRGVRLAIVSGDLIEDTIVPQLMERAAPGLIAGRRAQVEMLPTTADMAKAIVQAVRNDALPTGSVIYVGETNLPAVETSDSARS